MTIHRKITSYILDLLFPPRCPGCDELLYPEEKAQGFCKNCIGKIERVGDVCCVKCGKPLRFAQEEYCHDCRKKKHYFIQNKAVYLYQTPMKEAMYRLKYSNRRCYAEVFAKQAAKTYGDWIREHDIDGIVPIPMYKRKERVRGYNQATVLAQCLQREIGVPVYADYVVRIRNSVPQKNLKYPERKNNMKNAFKIRKKGVKLKKILLIDDIYTTGSTMDEVSKVLLTGGVEEVYCMSICIGADR